MLDRLYVGNLADSTNENDLELLFSRVGPVNKTELIHLAGPAQTRGFGFVTMASEADAETAAARFHGTIFHDHSLVVDVAKPQFIRRTTRETAPLTA